MLGLRLLFCCIKGIDGKVFGCVVLAWRVWCCEVRKSHRSGVWGWLKGSFWWRLTLRVEEFLDSEIFGPELCKEMRKEREVKLNLELSAIVCPEKTITYPLYAQADAVEQYVHPCYIIVHGSKRKTTSVSRLCSSETSRCQIRGTPGLGSLFTSKRTFVALVWRFRPRDGGYKGTRRAYH